MKAIFFIGLPCSGKSSLIKERNYTNIISADDLKETHIDYDPNNVTKEVHEWSVAEAERLVYDYLKGGYNFTFDGGGVNNSYNLRILNKVKEAGYDIHLIYIKTPLLVCIDRMSKRERKVPINDMIDKSFKIEECFNKQLQLVNSHEIIEYFTNKYLFIDMDGVLAEYQTIYSDNKPIDFVNGNIFKNSLPVIPMQNILLESFNQENIFVLSASPNSICNKQKIDWLEKYYPFIKKENIFFVGDKNNKVVMLNQLIRKFKLKTQDVLFVDDLHTLLWEGDKLLINTMHPSKFLANFYKTK